MTPSRKKPGVAFWATVVVVVGLVAYPLSFGPACWLVSKETPEDVGRALWTAYAPLVRCALFQRHPAAKALLWWAGRRGALNMWFHNHAVPHP